MASTSEWTTRRMLRGGMLAVALTAAAGLTASLSGRMSGSLMTLELCLAGTVVSFATEWRRGAGWRWRDRPQLAAAGAGALSLFLAPFLVLTHRFTDAPSGTELLFLTTSSWGTIAAIAASAILWRSRSRRAAVTIALGALAALAGSMGVLANWERPSSFSPFVRFPVEDVWMLLAGVAFVAGALLLGSAKRKGAGFPFLTASAAATALAFIAWVASGDGLSTLPLAGMWEVAGTWAIIAGIAWFAWNRETITEGPLVPAAALFAPPLLLPVLSAFESAAGIPGVNPLVWGGVVGGALLAVAGIVRMLVRRSEPGSLSARSLLPDRWSRGVGWAAAALIAVAAVALVSPALRAVVHAVRDEGDLDISWVMNGWESAAVWAVVGLALLLLATAVDDAWPASLAGLLAVPAYWLLVRTPTHVWVSTLSSDIQQDYGAEYANITFVAVTSWPARVAAVGAAVGFMVVLARRVLGMRRTRAEAPVARAEEHQ